MNKVILIGNLTKDPELTTTTNGISVCRFKLAISRRFTNAEGERETDFIDIVVWRNIAEICHKYLKKGSKAAVSGHIQSRVYDATDGTKRYVTEVIAEEVEFVGSKIGGSDDSDKSDDTGTTKLEPIDDDSLPF